MTHKRCDYCESKDCNGRCSRSALKRVVENLRRIIDALEMGERTMERELDRLTTVKRDLDEQLRVQWREQHRNTSPGVVSDENQPA